MSATPIPINTSSAISTTSTTAAAQRVVPLLQALNRAEENAGALAMRLDPITNHVPTPEADAIRGTTVTDRLQLLGDTLQYLLDNIEL